MTRQASNLALRWVGVWIALVLMPGAVSNVAGTPDALQLVTAQEAAAAPEFRTRGAGPALPKNGPVIRIMQPTVGGDVTAPFPLEIEFEPRPGGSPARMDTLRVTYLKLIELDITDRVKPYVTANRVLVKECNIPQGRHRVKISVADGDGNTTAEIIEMRVR
jgi:hypothetical protein